MGLFDRPDQASLEQAIRIVSEIDHQFGMIAQASANMDEVLRNCAEDYCREKVTDTMRGIPVDELNRNKEGIRLSVLRNNGIENLAQLLGMSYQQLVDLNGIGELQAERINSLVQGMASDIRRSVNVRLSMDARSPASDRLVRALYRARKLKANYGSCSKIYRQTHDRIRQSIRNAEAGRGGMLSWMFASGSTKENARAAAEYLQNLSTGGYRQQAEELFREYRDVLAEPAENAWKDFSGKAADYTAQLEKAAPYVSQAQETRFGLPEDLASEVEQVEVDTTGLNCSLRNYQYFGVQYCLSRGNVLLGDEMGLGKTVEAIAVMVSLRNSGASKFIVVCPAAVLENWLREIRKHSDLSAWELHGKELPAALEHWSTGGGVAVTTYETAGRLPEDADMTADLLVVDEAHYIKNPEANRTKVLLELRKKCKRALFMTGTPLENKVDEMCFLVSCLQPQVARKLEAMKDMTRAPEFRKEVAGVYFRRTREDVLTELPDLIEKEEWCTLGSAEQAVYDETVMDGAFMTIRQLSWNAEKLEDSCKADRLKELVEEAGEDGRKIIVFSFYVKTIEKVMTLLGDRCFGPINGSVSPAARQVIIDEFTKAEPGAVLAAQIQAGGTGLNIQAASVVILCEPQLKPSAESQAIARAYRMGQARNVLVYRLLCKDTIDERVMDLLEQKQKIFDSFADESVAGQESLEISDEAFKNMVAEEQKRVREKQAAEAARNGEAPASEAAGTESLPALPAAETDVPELPPAENTDPEKESESL